MNEFKAGDITKVVSKKEIAIFSSDKLTVIENLGRVSRVSLNIMVANESLELFENAKNLVSEYPKSNRKKLHDYIKSTGHTSVKLGGLVGNKWHFSNITKKSRFDSRGDISDGAYQFHKAKVVALVLNLNNSKPEKQSTVSDESVSEARKEEIIRELDLMQGRTVIVNNYQEKQANWTRLNKIAFLICVLFLISISTILYNIVSK